MYRPDFERFKAMESVQREHVYNLEYQNLTILLTKEDLNVPYSQ